MSKNFICSFWALKLTFLASFWALWDDPALGKSLVGLILTMEVVGPVAGLKVTAGDFRPCILIYPSRGSPGNHIVVEPYHNREASI